MAVIGNQLARFDHHRNSGAKQRAILRDLSHDALYAGFSPGGDRIGHIDKEAITPRGRGDVPCQATPRGGAGSPRDLLN